MLSGGRCVSGVQYWFWTVASGSPILLLPSDPRLNLWDGSNRHLSACTHCKCIHTRACIRCLEDECFTYSEHLRAKTDPWRCLRHETYMRKVFTGCLKFKCNHASCISPATLETPGSANPISSHHRSSPLCF